MNKDRREQIAAVFPLIGEAVAKLAEAREAIEGIKDEEEEYLEAMPEGLKGGDKGETAQVAIQSLDEALGSIDTIDANGIARALEEASDRAAMLDLPEATLTPDEADKRRWDRLPQFAKDHIERLKAEKVALIAEMAAMFGDPAADSSKPLIGDYMSPMKGRELPCERVQFPQVAITIYLEHGNLCAHSDTGMVTILPRCSNEVWLRSERF